jgi:hypothetical protein
MPALFCGYYVTGDGQAGMYHPFHLMLYRLLPLTAAIAVELLAGYPLLWAGTWLFLRRRMGNAAAMFGSLVFTFSGYNLLHFVHPNVVAAVAHLPWLLWAIDVALVERGRRAIAAQAGVALLTGSQLLIGCPQYVWFSLLTEVAYGGWVLAELSLARRASGKTEADTSQGLDFSKAAFQTLIALGLGVLLGAVQWLPTLDALGSSQRDTADAAFINSGSLHPLNLVQLVAPYLFKTRVVGDNTHEFGLYFGAVPLALLVWLPSQWRRLGRLRPLVLAAAMFGVVALLLAFGQYAPLYRLQQALPLVGKFRFPCRYIVLVELSMAIVAAVAFALLLRNPAHGRGRLGSALLAAIWTASLLAAGAGLWLYGWDRIAAPWAVLAGPGLIGLAALLVAAAARGVRSALVGILVFTVADLTIYGFSYTPCGNMESWEEYRAHAQCPPGEPGPRVLMDLIKFDQPGLRTGNAMLLNGWRRADGYAGFQPQRRLDYHKLPALRAAGIGWVQRGAATAGIEGLTPLGETWLRVPDPMPRVRLAASARVSNDPKRDLDLISLETTALLDQPLSDVADSLGTDPESVLRFRPAGSLPQAAGGAATLLSDRPGRLEIEVKSSAQQVLVIAESYHSGWHVRVNGRMRPLLRVNGDFLGCVVGPEDRDVVLEFRPRSLAAGRILSCLGALLLGIFTWRRLDRS